MSSTLIPQAYICPLTKEIMKDPFSDPDGHTYEKVAIYEWLATNQTSPITRNQLTINSLYPNRALKDLIENFCIQNPNFRLAVPAPVVQSSVKKIAKIEIQQDGGFVNIMVGSQASADRLPTDICCVLDVSGSMGEAVTVKSATGGSESFNLSRLDLVKHAMKTIIHSLGENDRVAIVAFTTTARIVRGLTCVNQIGRTQLASDIDSLRPENSTNIWGGLEMAMNLMKTANLNRNSSIFLLTDGIPNVEPSRGHIPTLQNYCNTNGLPCPITTFGFGYDLDSNLLVKFSNVGLGTYNFIPDASFVGTIFTHAISGVLARFVPNAKLNIEACNGLSLDLSSISCYDHQINDNGITINLGSLIIGQSKNIALPIKNFGTGGLNNLRVRLASNEINVEKLATIKPTNQSQSTDHPHIFRLKFVSTIREAMQLINYEPEFAYSLVTNLAKTMRQSSSWSTPYVQALVADLEGQVFEAFSKLEWYNRWGRHYLPSLERAHLYQFCNNFKDKGIQFYCSPVFEKNRDQIDTIFSNLPPPTPSISNASNSQIYTMSTLNNSNNPCFHGSCHVKMADGTTKLVEEIVKGDRVGHSATVKFVLKTLCSQGVLPMVSLDGGLLVTPWHPILFNGQWQFPCYLNAPETVSCNAVYSFVLEGDSHDTIEINGYQCATLGHHLTGSVIEHPYYGTDKVINDLVELDQKNTGRIVITPEWIVRDDQTGLVRQIREPMKN